MENGRSNNGNWRNSGDNNWRWSPTNSNYGSSRISTARRNTSRDFAKKQHFNFYVLQSLSKQDSNAIITVLSRQKEEFQEFLRNDNSPDLIVLILRILVNVCQANFTETVTSILSSACSANFLRNLASFMTKLPFESPTEVEKNKFYHEDTDGFWSNLIEFFRKAIDLMPNKARDEIRSNLEKLDMIFKNIEMNQKYKIQDSVKEAAQKMLADMNEVIKRYEESKNRAKTESEEVINEEEPPEDFRLLSTVPTVQDFYNPKPFIRPCKIKDAYNSVEHYLDVQFRLLREDFVSPLRNGLHEYLNGGNNRNQDLRVYSNVNLVSPAQNNNNVGIIVFFGIKNYIKWRYSKRFMFGGLLLLSRDNFNTILFATVANRDESELEKGLLMIEPCLGTTITKDMYNSKFVMLESKIYFEPYLAVLNAMKRMNNQNFPMQIYLVDGQNSNAQPKYLKLSTLISSFYAIGVKLPKGSEEWPSARQLKLDETQYDAFKCALTQEFAVIQGPPGTGKTFIALKIISTLLVIESLWSNHGPIVVVCLTNHALDQFLEGICEFTDSILRIGSRSKSEKLKKYTLMERRKDLHSKDYNAISLMYEKKDCVEHIVEELEYERLRVKLLSTPNVIVSPYCFKQYCNCEQLREFRSTEKLVQWLIEDDASLLISTMKQQKILHRPSIVIQGDNGKRMDENDDRCFDDELELDTNIIQPEHFEPCYVLQSIDQIIEVLNKNIIMYRRRYPEFDALPFDPTLVWEDHIFHLTQQRMYLQQMLAHNPLVNPPQFPVDNPRWNMYWNWVRIAYDEALERITELEADFRQMRAELNDAKELVDLQLMKSHKIVGLTTTGAARLHASVRALHAPIVLVEEAAEILEAHVVCSLSQSCQHVILIGDHKQLKPKASVYELGKKYNLNISLFERMVNIRGNCTQLGYQHRMRPEIAKLITPSIYEKLYNHKSVLDFPDAMGMKKNVFFLNHTNNESSENNEESWVNHHEARFLVELARYLILQGYDASEVTILCTYTGQLFLLNKEIERYSSLLKQVRVTTVDNYQGEENRIILLSLVRNNEEGNVGFLKEENRVCVALSRAREGLYIMGNMNDLTVKNNIWSKIKKVLEDENAIGEHLELQCQIHSDEMTQVKNVEDFEKCPEGGCLRKCVNDLPCGHTCTSICHILDQCHKMYKCMQPCKKSCPNDHSCKLLCWEGCRPCLVTVERKLKCGHTARMPCSCEPDWFSCSTEVDATLPDCGHNIQKNCSTALDKCHCTYPCEDRLPCGHTCELRCHLTNDPDHLEYKCFRKCVNYNLNCENKHQCNKKCHEECEECAVLVDKTRSCGHYYKKIKCSQNVEVIKCTKKCNLELSCGHKCMLQCFDTCGNCSVLVKKDSSCGHSLEVKCCEEATPSKCDSKCTMKLPCGHPCTKKCKQECTKKCKQMIKLSEPGPCGHTFSVPCYLTQDGSNPAKLLGYCHEPCKALLACEHTCEGNCGKCKEGRLHIPCIQACKNTLICGHECTDPCKNDCEPCKRQCELKCRHGKCNKKCGMPCTPCQQWCGWGCEHRRCKKRCYELCDVEPCNFPCKKTLKCKHPCVGFCGDPCPPLCRICNKDQLTKILFGNEAEEGARFVFLEDCKHCIENKGLMQWLTQPKESIEMKTCPRCKTPIRKCTRIMNQIKEDLKYILLVKDKIFYKNKEDLIFKQKLYVQNLKVMMEYPIVSDFPELSSAVQNLLMLGERKKNKKTQVLKAQEIEAFKIIIEILNEICDTLQGFKKHSVESYEFLRIQVTMLAQSLPTKFRNMSEQEITDFHLEIGRLSCMAEMHKLDTDEIKSSNKEEYDNIVSKLLSIERFTESIEREVRGDILALQNLCAENVILERNMIVKAVGFQQGHWFKCSNGHIYTIGECGVTMNISQCSECRAKISDNSLASEMDGATESTLQEIKNDQKRSLIERKKSSAVYDILSLVSTYNINYMSEYVKSEMEVNAEIKQFPIFFSKLFSPLRCVIVKVICRHIRYFRYSSFILYQTFKIIGSYIETIDIQKLREIIILAALAALWIALKKHLIDDDMPEMDLSLLDDKLLDVSALHLAKVSAEIALTLVMTSNENMKTPRFCLWRSRIDFSILWTNHNITSLSRLSDKQMDDFRNLLLIQANKSQNPSKESHCVYKMYKSIRYRRISPYIALKISTMFQERKADPEYATRLMDFRYDSSH